MSSRKVVLLVEKRSLEQSRRQVMAWMFIIQVILFV